MEEIIFKIRPISNVNKDMANGMRNQSTAPLSESEIEIVKTEIRRIQADESVFVFNDPDHLQGTCYNFEDDKIYIAHNVFPDDKYASTHPRDLMSVGAVLAHEYYGHRHYRDEYEADLLIDQSYHTTPIWEDECRASLTAAQIAPGLTQIDRRDLVMDAIYRAKEFGQLIEMNEFMKEVVYGYNSNERQITGRIELPTFVSEASQEGNIGDRTDEDHMSNMRNLSYDYDDFER